MCILKNSLSQSHELISRVVCNGDTVVDATAGNGNDTAFLAKLVGTGGQVYSFDIQQSALDTTRNKLEAENFMDRVKLINDGHQNMLKYVKEPIKAAMFNLGYLPGGDHNIGTRADTTIEAIKSSMELLVPHGIISIVVYYGGDSGFDEKNEVMNYIRTIDCKKFTVMQTEFVNQINCPPIFVCVERIK
jgi:predicted methyltransferase